MGEAGRIMPHGKPTMPRTPKYRLPTTAGEYVEELHAIRRSRRVDYERDVAELRRFLRALKQEGALDAWEAELGGLVDAVAADFAHKRDTQNPAQFGNRVIDRRKFQRKLEAEYAEKIKARGESCGKGEDGKDEFSKPVPYPYMTDVDLDDVPDGVFYPDAAPTSNPFIDEFIRDQAMKLVAERDAQRAIRKMVGKALRKVEKHEERAERYFAKADAIKVPAIATPTAATSSSAPTGIAAPVLGSAPSAPPGGGTIPVTPPFKKTATGSAPKRKRWDGTPEETKAVMMARAVHEGGKGLAISVNLTDEMVRSAAGRSRTLAQQLQDRISRLLKRRLGYRPDFFIVLERGPREAPHFHGVIDLPNDKATLEKVKSALMALGGTKLDVTTLKRKVNIQSLYTPARWGEYPFKHQATSKHNLGTTQLLTATNSLRKRGEAAFNAAKRANKTSGS